MDKNTENSQMLDTSILAPPILDTSILAPSIEEYQNDKHRNEAYDIADEIIGTKIKDAMFCSKFESYLLLKLNNEKILHINITDLNLKQKMYYISEEDYRDELINAGFSFD